MVAGGGQREIVGLQSEIFLCKSDAHACVSDPGQLRLVVDCSMRILLGVPASLHLAICPTLSLLLCVSLCIVEKKFFKSSRIDCKHNRRCLDESYCAGSRGVELRNNWKEHSRELGHPDNTCSEGEGARGVTHGSQNGPQVGGIKWVRETLDKIGYSFDFEQMNSGKMSGHK